MLDPIGEQYGQSAFVVLLQQMEGGLFIFNTIVFRNEV